MSTDHKTTDGASLRNRTIRTGDTTLEVTEREVRLRCVEYLYKAHQDAPMQRRLATPEEVMQSAIPEVMFQVSSDGYDSMRQKAERILALWRGERLQ